MGFLSEHKKRLFFTILLFTVIWLIFTEFDFRSFIIGVFFIAAAAVMASWLFSQQSKGRNNYTSIQLIAIPRFILFFILQSILGGIDTAKRAFSKHLNIAPGFIHYQLRLLTLDVNTNLFFNLLSLLPGSAYVTNEPQGIVIHFLSLTESSIDEIKHCEQEVARLYNIKPTAASYGETK